MGTLLPDLRYGARMLRKNSGFTAVAVLSLGLGIWANTDFNLAPGVQVGLARGLFVSGDFFRLLAVPPLLGRVFSTADDRAGCGLPGAVISHAFWQGEFGGDPSAVGRSLKLNDHPVEVIGVTPAGFTGLEVGHAWEVAVPICSQAVLWSEGNWLEQGTVWWLTVMGRRKPGWTLEKTNAQLSADSPGIFQASLPANYPPVNGFRQNGLLITQVDFTRPKVPSERRLAFVRDLLHR